MTKPIRLVTKNGRIMTESTAWWIDNVKGSNRQLFCIHNINLRHLCIMCKKAING